MFTGLVETLAEVALVAAESPGRRLVIRAPDFQGEPQLGDSIAVNGCCLTVVGLDADAYSFQAGPETLERTNLGELKVYDRVNLERSLRVGDRLGGHFVSGHIDGVGTLDTREDAADWATLWFRAPRELAVQMVSKGSVAVDGVSLTLVDVEVAADHGRFSVALIPHTLAATTLGELAAGDRVNLETDMLAKLVANHLSHGK